MAIRVIDDSKLQDIAVAIQGKDGGGTMTVDEMPARIDNIPPGEPAVANPALILMDWEGTVLKKYAASDVAALIELPNPASLPLYDNADHELLSFQNWNWSIEDIKAWVQNHAGHALTVGAIYTTTDSQDHNYWNNPRLDGVSNAISIQKRATTSIGDTAFLSRYSLTSISIPQGVTSIGGNAFNHCYSLKSINIPQSVTSIGDSAFYYCNSLTSISIPQGVTSIGDNAFDRCYSLKSINIPQSVTSIRDSAFYNCYSLTSINIPQGVTSIGRYAFSYCSTLIDTIIRGTPSLPSTNAFSGTASGLKFYVPRANLSWFETATNWSTYYAQNRVVAIEDYIEYLESIGYNVDKYKEVSA